MVARISPGFTGGLADAASWCCCWKASATKSAIHITILAYVGKICFSVFLTDLKV